MVQHFWLCRQALATVMVLLLPCVQLRVMLSYQELCESCKHMCMSMCVRMVYSTWQHSAVMLLD